MSDVKTEIRREESFMGARWIVYVDGKRRNNCATEARARKVAAELRGAA